MFCLGNGDTGCVSLAEPQFRTSQRLELEKEAEVKRQVENLLKQELTSNAGKEKRLER